MKVYLLSLAVGLLVGAIYGLSNVRSPAPPIVALVGLLGILTGEQLVPFAKSLWSRAWADQSSVYQGARDQAYPFKAAHDKAEITEFGKIQETSRS
jgi:XapX domain-containing protein